MRPESGCGGSAAASACPSPTAVAALTRKTLGETAGYGLLSIRERIELLGGRMTIKSAQGQGSTFRIVVPDSEKPEDTVGVGPRAYPTSATPGGRGGKRAATGGRPYGCCWRTIMRSCGRA